jgi:fructosamine-3-kinase
MIIPEIKSKLLAILAERHEKKVGLDAVEALSGGSINEVYKLITSQGIYLLKQNSAKKFPGMFEAEKKGLELLKNSSSLRIPSVIAAGDIGEESFLLMEYIHSGPRDRKFFEDFGAALAKMHRCTEKNFGLDHDNYIGSLKQSNKEHPGWAEFFIEERIEKQVKLAIDNRELDNAILKHFGLFYKRLDEIFPAEAPALLHGDLWSGNFLSSANAEACLIDPSVYYGHREMDIAMTKMFGGFEESFYTAYINEWPLEKEWKKRVELCNLYPLLVHVNLFGGSYTAELKKVIGRF